jgi:hypothetical protein
VEEDFYSVDDAARIMKLTPGRIRQMLRASEVDRGVAVVRTEVKVKGVPEAHIFIAPRLQAFALPIIQGIRFFSSQLSRTPKPDGAMKGVQAPRGIIRLWCGGTAQGALGDRGGAITRSLLK